MSVALGVALGVTSKADVEGASVERSIVERPSIRASVDPIGEAAVGSD